VRARGGAQSQRRSRYQRAVRASASARGVDARQPRSRAALSALQTHVGASISITFCEPSLVPPPRRLLLAYHGVLASHAGWRAAIVPAAPSDAQPAGPKAPRSPGRLPWATLLRRVFAIERLVCERGGGPPRSSAP
jgi:hypothetical protein